MPQHPVELGRAYVAKVHAGMLVLAIVVAGFCALIGWQQAQAAFAGGLAVLLPHWCVAKRLLQPVGAKQASQFVFAFWVLQGLKWFLTAVILGTALFWFKPVAVFVFIGCIVIFQGFWIIPLILARKGVQ